MEKNKWSLVNAENVVPYVCDETYSSKQLTGDEMAGFPVINVNEGTLTPHHRTSGAAHDDTEIYYIKEGEAVLHLDDDAISVKPGDFIIIPPHTFHWIDNTMNDTPFVIYTIWPKQEQNDMYFIRKKAWGTSMKYVDPKYIEKRLDGKE